MLKQTITFLDLNGEERTETLYFNFSEAELVGIQAASEEGIQKEMEDAVKSKDMQKLLDFIKMLVEKSYGEPDKDGIHFNKSKKIRNKFVNSAMYSPLLLSLFQDEGARAEKFITGLMPADLVKRALSQVEGKGTQSAPVDPSVPQVALSAREQFEKRSAERRANEAAPIGLPEPTVTPYLPATPSQPMTTPEFSAPEPATPIQSEASPLDAPPVDAQPFHVAQVPLDEVKEAEERAAYEAWKASQGQQL